jgi:hypothetical protein
MPKKMSTTLELPKVGQLNQKSLDKLTQLLRENPTLRKAAIRSIRSNPTAFVEKVFSVTKAQRLTLQTAIPKELEIAIAEFYILALNNPDVRVIKAQTNGKPQVTLELSLTATAPSLRQQLTVAAKPEKDKPTIEGEGKIKTRC